MVRGCAVIDLVGFGDPSLALAKASRGFTALQPIQSLGGALARPRGASLKMGPFSTRLQPTKLTSDRWFLVGLSLFLGVDWTVGGVAKNLTKLNDFFKTLIVLVAPPNRLNPPVVTFFVQRSPAYSL